MSSESLEVPIGENLGEYTVKQPKIKDLKIDLKGTDKMRAKMAKVKKTKITVNVDEDLLSALKLRSDESGVPYQVLLNKLLRASIADQLQGDEAARLDRLEKDVATLKRKLSA